MCQSIENRIKDIKKMYAEIGSVQKNEGNKDCKNGSVGKISEINFEGTKIYQKSTFCNYSNGYRKLILYQQGWEWSSTTEYYFKNGMLFFVFSNELDLCNKSEFRLYFDIDGNAIRILEKASTCENENNIKNVEIYDFKRKNELIKMVRDDLKKGLSLVE
jgi:hypothetical protein